MSDLQPLLFGKELMRAQERWGFVWVEEKRSELSSWRINKSFNFLCNGAWTPRVSRNDSLVLVTKQILRTKHC